MTTKRTNAEYPLALERNRGIMWDGSYSEAEKARVKRQLPPGWTINQNWQLARIGSYEIRHLRNGYTFSAEAWC